jgi:dipeptidyl aminopeptidase/acylaminoacyl peptidase
MPSEEILDHVASARPAGARHQNQRESVGRLLQWGSRFAARILLILPLLAIVGASSAAAQAPAANKANWALVEKFSSQAIGQNTYSTSITPGWINETDSLWYSWRDRDGTTFYLVQPKLREKKPLFNHEKMAAQLATLHKTPVDPKALPFNAVTWMKDTRNIRVTVDSFRYEYNLTTEVLKSVGLARDDSTANAGGRGGNQGRGGNRGRGGGGGRQGRGGGGGRGGAANFRNYSPDSTHFAFAKEHNLFVVIVATGDTVQLTRDGVEDYSFGFRDTSAVEDDSASAMLDPEEQMLVDIDAFYNNSDLPGDEQRFRALQQQQGGGTVQQQQGGGTVQQQQQQRGGGRGNQQQGGRGGGRGGGQESNDPRTRANVSWSTDSKTFYITRADNREIEDLYLVNSMTEPRPTVRTYRYAMPGDEKVSQAELFAWRVGDREARKLPVSKWKDQRLMNTHYGSTSERIRLWRRDRLQRNGEFLEIDLANGNEVKVLISESVTEANIEPSSFNVTYFDSTRAGDMITWSERTGWGHYYLYDNKGNLKNAITSGPWRAEQIVRLDTAKRVAYIAGVGRESGENPYYRHLYRVNLDGTGFTLLDAGNASHASSAAVLSPSRRYSVDVSSRMDSPPAVVLRDATGGVHMDLEKTDISRLQEMGWKMPEPFKVKAADGVTDIYGNLFKPFDFDSTKKYPIILSIYPGPQTEQVTYTFSANAAQQRLAQLGFIVIQIGNRGGSPQRSNAYQAHSYYNLRDYGLADKKAGVEQLAARHPWIDIDRVGMYGHSGGGFMTAAALLVPPYNDFFKVGVSSSGNHDNNVYNQNWSEQYHGLTELVTPKSAIVASGDSSGNAGGRGGAVGRGGRGGRGGGGGGGGGVDGGGAQQQQGGGRGGRNGGGAGRGGAARGTVGNGTALSDSIEITFDIHIPTNAEVAENLKGRLLLVHGDMDNNVHHAGTIRLADALIRANKRFDLFVMPGQAHGYGQMQTYFNRMLYEYFSEGLLGDYYRGGAEIR